MLLLFVFVKGQRKLGSSWRREDSRGIFCFALDFLKMRDMKQFLKATDVTSHVRKNWWSKREKRAFVE